MVFSKKRSRSSSAILKTRSLEPSIACVPSTEVVAAQPSQGKHDSHQIPIHQRETILQWLRKDNKQILDAIQRLTCLGLAAWILFQTKNIVEFAEILTLGFIDARKAKEVIARVIKATITEGK